MNSSKKDMEKKGHKFCINNIELNNQWAVRKVDEIYFPTALSIEKQIIRTMQKPFNQNNAYDYASFCHSFSI